MTSPDADAATDAPATGSSALQTAVVANLVGRAWPIVLGFVAVPIYLRQVGEEAYGLVGAFAILQAVCSILDMGLGASLTRQLARTYRDPGSAAQCRNLVRSLEIPYWTVAAVLALASVALAGPVAARWLKPEKLSLDVIRDAGMLMGLCVAAQLPFTLYSGGLLGLERQVLLNGVIVAGATVRVVATVLVLQFVSPTMEAFFLCQLAVSALQTAAGAVTLWTSLPRAAEPARFDRALFRANARFAAGVAGITVVSLALTQADKVILSRMLTLRDFAYYGIAAQVASAIGSIAQPVFTAMFPRFSQVAASGDETAERREYHRASQLLAVLLLPVATVLACFSHEVILAWTGRPRVADNAQIAATLLVIGWALNGLMNVPYAMMLAHGWTRLPFVTNVVAVVLLVPALFLATVEFGTAGAASAWLALNLGYVLISIPILHTRVLRGEKANWYVRDVALPLIGALAGALVAAVLLPDAFTRVRTLARVGAITAVSFAGAVALAPEIRRMLLGKLGRAAR